MDMQINEFRNCLCKCHSPVIGDNTKASLTYARSNEKDYCSEITFFISYFTRYCLLEWWS